MNKEYSLGYQKGKIDLKHDAFLAKLSKENESLGKRISKYESWIKNISDVRDYFIHKKNLIALPTGESVKTALKGEIVLLLQDGSCVAWRSFYRPNIANMTKMFEIVCNDLIERRQARKGEQKR